MSTASPINRKQDLRQIGADAEWLDAAESGELLDLIARCFKGVDAEAYLHKYFLADDCFSRRLRLFYADSRLVGYCLLTFRGQETIGGRSLILIGASAGFLPAYRHGNHTLRFSMQTAFGYKLRHPRQQVYYADTMLSPAMYRVMAKSVALIYPNADTQTPPDVSALLRLLQPEEADPSHVVYVGRKSDYPKADLVRFAESDKPEIRFYLQVNPRFSEGYALLTVMPVSALQLLLTLLKQVRST